MVLQSPEMMRREETGETYALSTDVFSYGILLNEIMCQKTPYEEMRLEPAQVTPELDCRACTPCDLEIIISGVLKIF